MVFNIKYLFCLSILLSFFKPRARTEMITATAEKKPLLEIKSRIIDVNEYITNEEKRLEALNSHLMTAEECYMLCKAFYSRSDLWNALTWSMETLRKYKEETTEEHSFTEVDVLKYIAYVHYLIGDIKKALEWTKELLKLDPNHPRAAGNLPQYEDIIVVQERASKELEDTGDESEDETTEDETEEMPQFDVAKSRLMTAQECFDLCKGFYFNNDFNEALAWGMEALHKHKEETDKEHSFTEVEVLEYITSSHNIMGDVRTAVEWTQKLLKLDPNHPRAAGHEPLFEKAIAEQEAANKKRLLSTGVLTEDEKDVKAKSDMLSEVARPSYNSPETNLTYEALCRGEMEINSDVAKRLFCRYMSENHPFLRLAPIKAEQVYIDPDVFVFHGVLSDDEIQVIKDLSMPRIESANFPDDNTGWLVLESFRVCKLTWLSDKESSVVARVSQRVADMTGLSVETAEELQVVKYGIGGNFEPHFDFDMKNGYPPFAQQDGDRIATVLFYMSDVAQGGATVFTELGLSVFPARGAALYWRNLHPSGEGDTATRHASCPVLRGSKWVCSKWVHEGGQELRKPCSWDCQREEAVRKIARAARAPILPQ